METKANRLGNFLIDLSEDSSLKDTFKKDPKATMVAQGLTGKEQQAILSGNTRILTDALATAAGIPRFEEAETESTTVVVVVVVVV